MLYEVSKEQVAWFPHAQQGALEMFDLHPLSNPIEQDWA